STEYTESARKNGNIGAEVAVTTIIIACLPCRFRVFRVSVVNLSRISPESLNHVGSANRSEQLDHIHRPPHHSDPRRRERGQLLLGGAGGARDDGARVPHPAALGGGLPGDEPDHRLGHLLPHERGGTL